MPGMRHQAACSAADSHEKFMRETLVRHGYPEHRQHSPHAEAIMGEQRMLPAYSSLSAGQSRM